MSTNDPPASSAGPLSPRRIVALVVVAEGLVAGAYGVYLAVETLIAPATERVAAVFLALTALALGAGLVAAGRAVAAGSRAARAPVLVWQLLQLAVAVPAIGPRWYVGVPLVVLAVVAGLGVLRSDVIPSDAPEG